MQGMPQFLDTLVTNRQGTTPLNLRDLNPTQDTLLVATEYLGALYAQPVLPDLDTIFLTVYDTGQATVASMSYQALIHPLGDTVPGYFMIEAIEVQTIEPIRGHIEALTFPVPKGAQVLQTLPQDGWDLRNDTLVFQGYLSPDNPFLQIQWVWQQTQPSQIRRTFPKTLRGGRVLTLPTYTLSGEALGQGKEISLPQGTFTEYPIGEVQALSFVINPGGGSRNATASRWILGAGGGALIAILLLLALRRRHAESPDQGQA